MSYGQLWLDALPVPRAADTLLIPPSEKIRRY
jgi:hypothetical protein